MQHPATQCEGLEGVVAPYGHQGSAHEGHRSEAIPQAHLAYGVGHVDGVPVFQGLVAAAKCDGRGLRRLLRHRSPAGGIARGDDQQRCRVLAAYQPVGFKERGLLTLVCGGCQPDGTFTPSRSPCCQLPGVHRQRSGQGLDRACHPDAVGRRTQHGHCLGSSLVLGVNPLEQRQGQTVVGPNPALGLGGGGRDAGIDQPHGRALQRGRTQQARPQVQLAPQGEVRLPVADEPPRGLHGVGRCELMNAPGGQGLLQRCARGSGCRRDQEMMARQPLAEGLEQGGQRQAFAHPDTMPPHHRAFRACWRIDGPLLTHAVRRFLAFAQSPGQGPAPQRRLQGGDGPKGPGCRGCAGRRCRVRGAVAHRPAIQSCSRRRCLVEAPLCCAAKASAARLAACASPRPFIQPIRGSTILAGSLTR